MLIITIKQGKEKGLQDAKGLIYVSAIDRVDGKPGERMQSGATAVVQTSSGQFLARAGYSPKSQIRARVWSYDQNEAIDHAFIKRRVKAAIARRSPKPGSADGSGGGGGGGGGSGSSTGSGVRVVKAVKSATSSPRPVRLIVGDEDGLPGLQVDWFMAQPGYLICRFLAAGVDAWKIPIVQTLMAETGCPNVYECSDELMRKAEALPDVSGALAGDEPPPDLLVPQTSGVKPASPKRTPAKTAGTAAANKQTGAPDSRPKPRGTAGSR